MSETFFRMFAPQSTALTLLVVSLSAVLGLALGSIKVRGVTLGIGGVLFAALLVGSVVGAPRLDARVIEFARDLGLVLFVYTIGAQIGPGFFASLRRQGLKLNGLAALTVVAGVATTLAVARAAGLPPAQAVGLMTGAVTNTPSLAAAGQTLQEVRGERAEPAVTAYAIAYPFGVLGPILAMLVSRAVFKINLPREAEQLAAESPARPPLATLNIRITNRNLDGKELRHLPIVRDGELVVSRVQHGEVLTVAGPRTVLHTGDVLLAVGSPAELDDLRLLAGEEAGVDLRNADGNVVTRRVVVTKGAALGRTVDELDFPARCGVRVTRVHRGDVEFAPSPAVRLQYGDGLTVVGEEGLMRRAAAEVGNEVKHLHHPQILTAFIGIALGVFLGSIPLHVPGVPAPVKLGLAGGPLIVAILLARLGHVGRLVWYLPVGGNFSLRELGIVLFLGAIGLRSGTQFFDTLVHGPGLLWLACGAVITVVPLTLLALIARLGVGLNYLTLCGLIAGSVTGPPALAFAGTSTDSDAPSLAYATVYPSVMVLRVVAAQLMVLFLA